MESNLPPTGVEELDRLLSLPRGEQSIQAERIISSALAEGLSPSDMTDSQLMLLHSSILACLQLFTGGVMDTPRISDDVPAFTRALVSVLIEVAGEIALRPKIMENIGKERETSWKITRLVHRGLLIRGIEKG